MPQNDKTQNQSIDNKDENSLPVTKVTDETLLPSNAIPTGADGDETDRLPAKNAGLFEKKRSHPDDDSTLDGSSEAKKGTFKYTTRADTPFTRVKLVNEFSFYFSNHIILNLVRLNENPEE